MVADSDTPLRLAVTGFSRGRNRDARLADFLARFPFPVQLCKPTDSEVVLQTPDAPPAPETLPVLLHPPVAESPSDSDRQRLAAELHRLPDADVIRTPGDRNALCIDVLSLFRWLIDGHGEESAPRDEFARPAPGELEIVHRGMIDRPAADLLAVSVGHALWELARGVASPPPPTWTFCASFDIDSPGMFRGRRILRSFREIASRAPSLLPRAAGLAAVSRLHLAPDPHLGMRELGEALEGLEIPATFFVQTHRRHQLDDYDLRHAHALTTVLRQVVRSGWHTIGLHSSLATWTSSPAFLQAQWKRLRRVLGRHGLDSVHRAHYLAVPGEMPLSPSPGRTELIDSSLAFGAREGFRRGTAHPFRVGPSVIELCPAVMDTTLRFHRGMDVNAAWDCACRLMAEAGAVGGVFVPVFHPHNLEELLWPGWRHLLFDLLSEAKTRGAEFQSLASAARSRQHAADHLEKELQNLS